MGKLRNARQVCLHRSVPTTSVRAGSPMISDATAVALAQADRACMVGSVAATRQMEAFVTFYAGPAGANRPGQAVLSALGRRGGYFHNVHQYAGPHARTRVRREFDGNIGQLCSQFLKCGS
eukprot:983360-Amphidinium_carterae.1